MSGFVLVASFLTFSDITQRWYFFAPIFPPSLPKPPPTLILLTSEPSPFPGRPLLLPFPPCAPVASLGRPVPSRRVEVREEMERQGSEVEQLPALYEKLQCPRLGGGSSGELPLLKDACGPEVICSPFFLEV